MTTAIKVFLGLAMVPYPFVLLMTWFIRGEADGLLGGFDTLAVMVVWLNLSIALLLAGIKNGIPWWSYMLAVPAIIFYLSAVYGVTELLRTERAQWMVVIPAVGPLVMFAYICWASIPQYRGMLSPNLASAGVWIALFALSVVPLNRYADAGEPQRQQVAKAEAEVKAHIEQFNHVPHDAPLPDFAPFLVYWETHDLALDKIRASKRKESDLLQLIQTGDYSLVAWIAELQVPATPALCQGGRKMLRDLSAAAKATAEKGGYVDVVSTSDRYISAIKYFADNKCPIQWTYEDLERVKLSLAAPKASPDQP
jgi:hypothetical protein